MPWRGALAAAVTPLGTISGDIVSYILGYGPLGIGVVIGAVLLYKGWGLYSPPRLDAVRAACRADLERENARLIEEKRATEERLTAEKQKAEQQRDEALRAASDQLVPMLVSFTGAVNSLLPLLQDLVRHQETRGRSSR